MAALRSPINRCDVWGDRAAEASATKARKFKRSSATKMYVINGSHQMTASRRRNAVPPGGCWPRNATGHRKSCQAHQLSHLALALRRPGHFFARLASDKQLLRQYSEGLIDGHRLPGKVRFPRRFSRGLRPDWPAMWPAFYQELFADDFYWRSRTMAPR